MSEFRVEVVRLEKVGKHPNADTLSISHVRGDYPVIFRTEDFREGDRAVYVPVDAIVPEDDPRWAFLSGQRRIRARRLRGLFSMGLLTHADPAWEIGRDVQADLGIEKWEPPILSSTHGENCGGPPRQWPIYDLEAYRRFPHVLIPGEQVVITEKIHGANGRWVWEGGELWTGSHRCWKARHPNIWWQVADMYGLARLEASPGVTLYGEVYGQVQDLRYGTQSGEVRLAIFDARGTDGRWLERGRVEELAQVLGCPMVPKLHQGPWSTDLLALAEGDTTAGGKHCREGIVIQAAPERFDEIGRVKLKHIGEGYYLRKEGVGPMSHGRQP